MSFPPPNPAEIITSLPLPSLAAPVAPVVASVASAAADSSSDVAETVGRIWEGFRQFDWRPWRLTSDKISDAKPVRAGWRRDGEGARPADVVELPDLTPSGDAGEAWGGTPHAGPSRAERRDPEACRGVGRAPNRSGSGAQVCPWCNEVVTVVGGKCGAHQRPNRTTYIASIHIGGNK